MPDGRGLGVVSLSGCMEVECLEVHCSARFSILLRANYHSMTPCDWFADWDRFYYTKADILVKPSLDLLSPVKWDRQGLMMGHRVASGSTINRMGGLSIMGRGWCWHMLKVLDW